MSALQSCVPPKGRVKLTDVNPHLVCVLCHGYFVDATSIVECLHSFCRSCIVLHLDKKSYCPICQEQIQNSKALKPDKALQDIVYKLVPGLFHSEMKRRQEFYQKHPHRDMHLHPEARGVTVDRIVYTADETISLSLEYYDKECEQEIWKNANDNGVQCVIEKVEKSQRSVVRKRYLRCPAAVRMSHLKKFIRMKYNLKPSDLVELLYRRESLPEEYSLMDIAYIYTWNRNEPMRFFYKINAQMTVPVFSVANKDRIITEANDRKLLDNKNTVASIDTVITTALPIPTPVVPTIPIPAVNDNCVTGDTKKSVPELLKLPAVDESKSTNNSNNISTKEMTLPLPPVVPPNPPISPEGTSRKENVSDNIRNSCANELKSTVVVPTAVQANNVNKSSAVLNDKKPAVNDGTSDVPMKKLEKLVDQQQHLTSIPVPMVSLASTVASKRPINGESKLNLSISKLLMKNRNAVVTTASTASPKFIPTPQQMQQIGMHTSIPNIQPQSPTQSPLPQSSQPNACVRPGYPGMHAFKRSPSDTIPIRSQAPTNRPPFIPVRKSYEWNKARNNNNNNTAKPAVSSPRAGKDVAVKSTEKLLAPKKSPLPITEKLLAPNKTILPAAEKALVPKKSPVPVAEKAVNSKNSTDELNAAQSLLRVSQDIRLQPTPKPPTVDSIHDRFNCESSLQITKVSDPGDAAHQPAAVVANLGSDKTNCPPSLQIMRVPHQQAPVEKVTSSKPVSESNNSIITPQPTGKPINKKPVPSLYSMQPAKRKEEGVTVAQPENGKRMERRVDTENGILSVSLLTETTKQDMDAKRREVVQPDVSIKLMTFPNSPAGGEQGTAPKKAPELNPIKRKQQPTAEESVPELGKRKSTPPSRPKDDIPQLIEINSSPYAKLLPAVTKKPTTGNKVLDLSKSPPNGGLVKRISPPKTTLVKRPSPENANGLKRVSPEAGGGSPSKKKNINPILPSVSQAVPISPSAAAAAINSNLLFAAQRQAAAFLLKQHFDSLNNGLLNRGKNGTAASVEWPRAMFNPALFARPPPTNLNN
ncbi:polycomb group protein Psc-like [Daktulosphaira vitifoliae]|uniref:polycomb group protein Psc-like n=1 Tax=Daktulosphaira vitifoliae TaxID=58002 RepID=UPI0021A9C579|nr:polycomb group protein Psc-like [Daktulosphaira vitifoliae]